MATTLGGTELFALLLVLSIAVSLVAYRLCFPYTLALSLPAGLQYRSQIQVIVYRVVLVTLVGQGVLMRLLLPRWKLADSAATQASA
ncbi:MAG TPA: hypothetical protein VF807_03860 [Ktedonobacterales bacterium]